MVIVELADKLLEAYSVLRQPPRDIRTTRSHAKPWDLGLKATISSSVSPSTVPIPSIQYCTYFGISGPGETKKALYLRRSAPDRLDQNTA